MPARTGGHATVTQPDRDEPGLYLSTGQPVEVVRIRLAPGRATSSLPNTCCTMAPPRPRTRPRPPRSGWDSGPDAP